MTTKVVGVTFRNEDGTSRESIIARMSETDSIILERDPYNEYDSNAVKVCVINDDGKQQIGHLPRTLAAIISPKMRRGAEFPASIVACGLYMDRPYCEIEIEGID